VMVGDSDEADGGAPRPSGCGFILVDPAADIPANRRADKAANRIRRHAVGKVVTSSTMARRSASGHRGWLKPINKVLIAMLRLGPAHFPSRGAGSADRGRPEVR